LGGAMKLLAWLSVIAGVPALLFLFAIVLVTPEWRSQVLGLSPPLNFTEPEATVLLVPSIALASLAIASRAPAYRRRVGQAGLVLGAVCWVGIFGMMGIRGLQRLF
jgi:hypothetical protein